MDLLDAVVVGAGVDGLVAASYLAKAGARVLVVEKRETVGGGAVSVRRKSGAVLSSEACAEPRLDARIVADLGLARHGYGVVPVHATYALAADRAPVILSSDDRVTANALLARSRRDAERFFDLRAAVRRALSVPWPARRNPLPLMPLRGRLSLKSALAAQATLPPRLRAELSHFWTVSIGDLLESYLETDLLKAHLAGRALCAMPHGPYAPYTAHLLSRHPVLAGDGSLGAYIRGGAGTLTDALAAVLASFGGSLRTSAPVVKVPAARNGKASVVLENGEEIEARVVLSSLGIARTVRSLLATEAVPSALFERMAAETRPMLARLDLVLETAPSFPALGNQLAREPGDIVLVPSLAALDAAHEAWVARKLPEAPAIILSVPSFVDPSRGAPNAHIVSALIHGVPERLADGPWTKKRGADFAARVIREISAVCPGIADRIREFRLKMPGDGEASGLVEEALPDALRLEAGLKHLLVCGPQLEAGVFSGAGGQAAATAALQMLSKRSPWPWR
jgi:phytoene dehydrogenase-like protein